MKKYSLSGDTKIICENYITNLKSRENKETLIWNGSEYKTIIPYLDFSDDLEYRVSFEDGSTLNCSRNQTFQINENNNIIYKKIEDLSPEDYIIKTSQKPYVGNTYESKAYTYGYFFFGGIINTYENKYYLSTRNINPPLHGLFIDKIKLNGDDYSQYVFTDVNFEICKKLKANQIPHKMFQWDLNSVTEFLAGYLDASIRTNKNAPIIYAPNNFLQEFQIYLSKYNIDSVLNNEELYIQLDKIPTKFFKLSNPQIEFNSTKKIKDITKVNSKTYYFYSIFTDDETPLAFNNFIHL